MPSVSKQPRDHHLCGAALVLLATLLGQEAALGQFVFVDSERMLQVNGSRFFPIGLVELGVVDYPNDWNERIRSSGANLVWDTGYAYAQQVISCEAVEDSAQAAGYYLLTGSPDTWIWDDPATPEFEVAQPMYAPDSLQSLNTCFSGFSRHLGYANRDEPVWTLSRGRLGDIDSLHILDTYDQLVDQDPFKIVGLNFAPVHLSENLETWKADIGGYLDATDVVLFASYPYPSGMGTCSSWNVVGYPYCKMDRLPDAIDIFLNELVEPQQPIWAIVQGHKGIPLREARWEATISIIHGATGVLWAGWNWTHAEGSGYESWPVIRQVISEFASLHDVLIQSEFSAVQSQEAMVEVRGKNDDVAQAVVFAGAREFFSGSTTIEIVGGDPEWAEVLFESRWIPIVDEQFVDFFAPYESHIYRVWSQGSADPPTGVGDIVLDAPFRVRVYPNPAFGSVRATFTIPEAHAADFQVYDITGRRVAQPLVERTSATSGSVVWDGRDASGRNVGPGVYFLRGTTQGATRTARVVLR